MPSLISKASALDEYGIFNADQYIAFDVSGILYCGDAMPDLQMLAPESSPSDWQIHDGRGFYLMPGMIDAHCHLGLFNEGLALEGEDGNERIDPVTPQLRAIDGLYHEDRGFREAVMAGVTTVMTGPGSTNILAGQFALVHTAGRSVDQMTIMYPAAMKAALGENPKRIHGQNQNHSPATRMACAAIFRDVLVKARWYRDRKSADDYKGEPDLRLEALLPALTGDLLFKFHVHRADDILTAVRLADEFGLRYTLDHCTEGYRIADQLRDVWLRGRDNPRAGRGEAGFGRLEGIVAGPLLTTRGKPELRHAELENPAILSEQGLPVAIMTDHPEVPIQYLPLSAMLAVKAGMAQKEALRAVTSTAARLCDAGDRIGRIKTGYQADLVLLDGHPFDYRSRTRQIWLKGQAIADDTTHSWHTDA